MAFGQKETKLVFGASPRVDLLPLEIKQSRKGASIRRMLGMGVVVTLVLVAGGYGYAMFHSFDSADRLADAKLITAELETEKSQYIEVRSIASKLDMIEAAERVGASTEINWSNFLNEVQATLPADVAIRSFTVDAGTPIEAHPQATVALQGQRVATLTFSATSPGLPNVRDWLEGLKKVTAFADATPGSVVFDEEQGLYVADITLHITEAAYSLRFATEDEKAAAAAAAESASTESEGN